MSKAIKLVSWNVKGVQNPVKMHKVLSHLESLNCDIAMIQETHTNLNESMKLKQSWVGQVFSSPGSGASRGVSILIAKRVSFTLVTLKIDSEGRYVILHGILENIPCTMVNIYAPNTSQALFLSPLSTLLAQYTDTPLIVGGDLNLVSDANVDRSGNPLASDRTSSAAFSEMRRSLALTDVWRLVNPEKRQYTFYSNAHNTYSRIDYLLISSTHTMNIIDTEIHSILISDHAPLSMTFSPVFNYQHRTKQWRFNNSLLQDEEFVSLISQRISEFFEINMPSVPSIQTVWEAFKVTCRGWIIAYSSTKRKLRNEKKKKQLEAIRVLELNHMLDTGNAELRRNLIVARADLQAILDEETAFALYQLRRKCYESGDKAGKMLAYQLKQQENRAIIPAIRDSNGNLVTEQSKINGAFREFYSNLYQAECHTPMHKMEEFVNNISLPSLSIQDSLELEAPIRDSETLAAINNLANGKSPGADGYTIEFYKRFQNNLSPILSQLFNDIRENQSMPMSMRAATISLIPKPGKDHLEMGSYRPLSILNNDYKILAKVLSLRLEKVVPSLVHLDQVGFIPGRLSSNNMRRLFQVMLKASSLQSPAIAISLDAEKAFDRVEWTYLFYVLSKYGFGPTSIQWFKALYNHPISAVKTNGLISKPFHLYRGTRQGCPLSPLIFVLALEPLACAIREHVIINGIKIGEYDFKINLYADDILLTLSNPRHSIPEVLKIVKLFSTFSGYKINWNKSEATPLNSGTFQADLGTAPFVWKPEGMRYLGITIRSPISKIFDLNGPPLLRTIRDDLKRWTVLPLSLWGRAEVLKMNILPRLTYIISAIPLKIPQGWFQEIDTLFSSFLWKDKKPRINRKKLSSLRSQGGLGVPDISLYHLSYNARFPLSWGYNDPVIRGSWQWLEKEVLMESNRTTSLASLWYHPKPPSKLDNPIIRFSCEVIKKLHGKLGIKGTSLPSCPLWNNPLLSVTGNPLADRVWQRQNIFKLGQVTSDGSLLTLDVLKAKFGLGNNSFLTYAQLKATLGKLSVWGYTIADQEDIDRKLEVIAGGRGTVSNLYRFLTLSSPRCNTLTQMKWHQDLGINMSTTEWDKLWRDSITVSNCVRYRVIQMKIMHRAYFTPSKLRTMDQSISDLCWHGCGEVGTLIHMLWHCPAVKALWEEVARSLTTILNVDIRITPKTGLLGARVEGVQNNKLQKVTSLACLAVKRLILLNWKVRKPSCFLRERWIEDFMHLLSMERATFILSDIDQGTCNLWDTHRSSIVTLLKRAN